MKILIYGGTTEGRQLAEILKRNGLEPVVSVATEYGEEVMEDADPSIKVRTGRMNEQEMHELAAAGGFCAVVDATHPFAAEVSCNIRNSLRGTGIPLLRLKRDVDVIEEVRENNKDGLPISDMKDTRIAEGSLSDTSGAAKNADCRWFRTVQECAEALYETKGNVLLTTGSKELKEFCRNPELKSRIFARVLPGEGSLRLCRETGLSGRQIIAMQGPFSKEMDLATIHQFDIRILVTKESGHTGGADAKMKAAKEAEISCFIIQRPDEHSEEPALSFEETLEKLADLTGMQLSLNESDAQEAGGKELTIALAGIGMGTEATMTAEVREAIKGADYLFGAERMLRNVQSPSCKARYAAYKSGEIAAKIRVIAEKDPAAHIVVLFSGDSGFYSGAAGTREALMAAGFRKEQIRTLPGISSLSYLSAAAGIPWQDAAIVSLHGVPEQKWKAELTATLRQSGKVFFLTSGASDVRQLGAFLKGAAADCTVVLGFQLSYPEERISRYSAEECMSVETDGLYAGFILRNSTQNRENVHIDGTKTILTPGIRDDRFIRGKVPMTKEEIRILSICKLHLQAGSVLYDIGSGTGSIAVEAALIPGMGDVYAIEQDPEAVGLIRSNAEKFGAAGVHVVEGMAPGIIKEQELPAPSHAFIGGSKGNLREILKVLREKNPGMRVVITAVTMETIRDIQNMMETFPITDDEIIAVSVSKAAKMGHYHLMQAANTVYVFSFNFACG